MRRRRKSQERCLLCKTIPVHPSAVVLNLDVQRILRTQCPQYHPSLGPLAGCKTLFLRLEPVVHRIAHNMNKASPERPPMLRIQPDSSSLDVDPHGLSNTRRQSGHLLPNAS